MLSRSAQGLYWMGRYLERTRHLCRLLELQTAALVDRPVREIYFGWRRIYSSVGRHPTGGSLEIGDDDYTLADSYTLADDLTFEPLNPSSIWSCLALGRENARQMRHCISAEMWTSLNLFYLRVQRLGIKDIWRVSPESFYTETSAEINTFSGIASTTMYRDDGWRFMQFGHLIERAQLSAALLTAHLAAETTTKEDSADDWTSLLRAYRAFEAYNRRYSIEVHPDRVLELLVADPMLPSSLCQSIDAASAELAGVAPGPDTGSSAAARRLVSRSMTSGRTAKTTDFLRHVDEYCRELHSRDRRLLRLPGEDLRPDGDFGLAAAGQARIRSCPQVLTTCAPSSISSASSSVCMCSMNLALEMTAYSRARPLDTKLPATGETSV